MAMRRPPTMEALLRVCGVCGKQAGPRCSQCGEDYCSRECQKRAWRGGHKTVCLELKAAVEGAVARGRSKMVAQAGAETYGPETATCWICCESGTSREPLLRGGCGCRGEATCGHLSCFVKFAEADARRIPMMDSGWMRCSVCKQRWTGLVSFELLVAMWRKKPNDLVSMRAIGAALGSIGEGAIAARVFRRCLDETRRCVGDDDGRVFDVVENLANVLGNEDATLDRAVDVLRACWRWRLQALGRNRHSTETDAETTATNLAHALLRSAHRRNDSGRYALALVLAGEAEEVLRPTISCDTDKLDRCHGALIYAEILAILGRLQDALALAETLLEKLNRIVGTQHTHYQFAFALKTAIALCRTHHAAAAAAGDNDPDAWTAARFNTLRPVRAIVE